jgi:hypothetical protein
LFSETRIKLAPANERDKQQLQWFCDACKGIPQVRFTLVYSSSSVVIEQLTTCMLQVDETIFQLEYLNVHFSFPFIETMITSKDFFFYNAIISNAIQTPE